MAGPPATLVMAVEYTTSAREGSRRHEIGASMREIAHGPAYDN
jgi:hypothetical protein